jgi:Putative polyhydroxyalkanoic acid system protein (PHA_gran_rgn)
LEEIRPRRTAMSDPLVVIIPHQLGKDEALRRVKPALGKASETFPALKVEQEVWSEDRLDFRVRALGQVAAGNVQVGERQVRLEVTLPWLLHKFAQVVQKTIAGRGQILLEKK